MNEYSDIIKQDQTEGLRSSLLAAGATNPDQEAELQKLATRTGMPVDLVRAKRPEVELQDRMASFDYDKVIKDSPKLTAWMADPKNAALAHDDWQNMSAIEKIVTNTRDYVGAIGGGIVGDVIGRTLSGSFELLDVAARGIDRPIRAQFGDEFANKLWYEPAKIGGFNLDPLVAWKSSGKDLKAAGDWMKPPQARQTLGTDVAGGVGQIGGQIAIAILTGGAASAAMLTSQGADVMAEKTARDALAGGASVADGGISSPQRDLAIVAGGAITAITEKYGLDKILNRVPPEVKNRTLRFIADKVAAGGIEAGQEFTEGLLHDIARKTLTNNDATLLDGVEREMTAAALSAAIVRTALGVKGHARASQQEQFVKSLTDTAEASKLRERMPERFQEYLQQVTANGPVENIFVPAERFNEYFQTAGLDPAVEASKLGVQNFAEASIAGGDVVIPTAQFVTQLSGTDHLQGLWNDLRFQQGDMTLREAKEFEDNRGDQVIDEETLQRMTGAVPQASGYNAVKEQIMGELAGRFDRTTADSYATQYAAVLTTLAERAGLDPIALADTYQLDVTMPLPDALREKLSRAGVDIDIDPLLDRMRAGDVPSAGRAWGDSLTEFVAKAGGVRLTGEVRDLDANIDRKPGQRKVVQPKGMALDDALQMAIEAGYFPNGDSSNLTESDLIDALYEDASGNRQYSAHNANDKEVGLLNAADALGEYLHSIGVDLETMSNAEIRARMRDDAAQDVGEVYDQNNGDKRGSITIEANRKMTISLFEKANLSTFLHETGHFYLEVMGDLATREGAAPQIAEDYQKILDWMGVKSGDEIEVKHHEMFARANEAYLMEGNAPSPELRGAFQRFKSWLLMIYKTVASLDVELSQDLRGVFDRMYATDQQIEAARGEAEFEAMFATAADAGMSEVEFQAYLNNVGQTIEQGRERLQTKLMQEMLRERTKQWKAARESMRADVAAEVDAEPVYVAFAALKAGQTEDGIAVKLSRDDLVREFGAPFLKSLPRGFQRIYSAEGGVDLDTAADMFGFDSGRTLIEQLVNIKPRDPLIEQITDERMREVHGDIRFDGTIAEEAVNALHNDRREDVLKIELRAIRKKAREVAPLIRAKEQAERAERQAGEQFVNDALPQRQMEGRTRAGASYTYQAFDPEPMKRAAAGMIGQKQIRDLRPHGYLLAERNAAKLGAKAMKAGDYMTAAEQKQRELFNHYLYKEATAVAEEVERKSTWLAEQGDQKKRQALGRAGADYLEQVDEILERYEFKKVPLNKLAKRESLATWVDQQEALGNAVSVPEDVLNEARRVNWKQVPVDELRAVYDSVKNIKHLAGLKNKLLVKGKQREFAEVREELLDAIYSAPLKSTGELNLPNMSGATVRQKGAAAWRRYDAAHLKIEQLVSWLDDGDINGAWARNFFDLADTAQTAEYDMHRRVTKAIDDLRQQMPRGWQSALFDKVGFDLPLVTGAGTATYAKPTRYTVLSIALNMGNEQNLQRLADGNRFTEQDLQKVRDSLTDDDLRFVQGVWDAVELLWPDMAALEKRASGLEPVKVEAASFEVRGKTYRGGYFPLVYDSRISTAGEKQVEGDRSVEAFVASGFGRPTTNKGATKKRVAQVNQPVLLDMNEVIGGHIAKVVKDISHREAVTGLHNILVDGQIKTALIDRVGEAYYRELRDWTKVLVNDRSDSMNAAKGAAKFAMVARTNLAIVTMGWKISTMMSQFSGFGPASDLVKPSHLAKALMQATMSPQDTWAMVSEKSGEMRNRVQTIDRDVRDSMRRIADKRSVVADIQRTAFILTSYADRMVSVPTWLGAYNQALIEGQSEETAIRAGDRAVRLSQGAGGAKDLAAVQRNNELMKLMTMYYTPFAALYARLRDVGHQQAVQGIGYLPKAAARLLALVVVPAVLGDLLAGRGPDDEEDEVWWAVRRMLMYPIAALPGVRDFSGLMEQKIIALSGEGQMNFAPSYNISPIVSAIGKAYQNLVNKPIDIAAGNAEITDEALGDAFESAGLLVGLPTAQVHITGGYLYDLMTGEAQPENAPEVVKGLMFKQKKEK